MYIKDQKERAHKKLIHDYEKDGRDSGTITQNDIDAECDRAAKPPAKKTSATAHSCMLPMSGQKCRGCGAVGHISHVPDQQEAMMDEVERFSNLGRPLSS